MITDDKLRQTADGSVQLEIELELGTQWLTHAPISELFVTSTDNVGLHLKNIYAKKELAESATNEVFSVVGFQPLKNRMVAHA